MRLGVPFIAARQLGAVGGQLGRPNLPSIGWRTGQSGAPPDRSSRRSGARSPSKFGISDRCSSALTGARDTVRCTPDSPVHQLTVGAVHMSCEDCAADHWRRRPLAHRTVRCTTGQSGAPPDSPVNYSHIAHLLFPRATSSPRMAHQTVRCTTGRSGDFYPYAVVESRERRVHADQPGAPETVRCTTGQSSVPSRAGVCCT
jgi:hypothetical protein